MALSFAVFSPSSEICSFVSYLSSRFLLILQSWRLLSHPLRSFADCIHFFHLWLKEHNQCDFDIDHLVMSMCRIFSCVVEKEVQLAKWAWREEICLKEAVLLFLILQISWQSEDFQNREQQIVVKLTQNSRAENVFENRSESGISPPELMRAQAQ